MSGIAGFVRLDRAPARLPPLERMSNAIAHRGPDGSGVFVKGTAALAQRTIFGMPEAHLDPQPRSRGHLTIVADARIDNRDELARALGMDSRELAGAGDPSLLLRAFEAWGEACPARLLGDFAFAIWDALERRLFCARDHFGARPFVYGRTADVFAFASDTRALHALGELPRRRNEGRIADFLVDNGLETLDHTSTFWLDLFRLPPAHTLSVRDGVVDIRRNWAPEPRERRFASEADIVDEFRSTFTEAVTCRVRGDRVGSMLSGGLDSSSIVAIARGTPAARGALPTFSAVGDDEDVCPDRGFVEAMIAQGGVDATVLRPSRVHELADVVRDHFDKTDDPFDSYVVAIPMLMYALAKQRGVKVVLDGVDGDLVTSQSGGAVLYPLREGKVGTAWRAAAAYARHYGFRSRLPTFVSGGLVPLAWATLAKPLLPSSAVEAIRTTRLEIEARTSSRASLIHPDLARRVDVAARFGILSEARTGDPTRRGPGWDHACNIAWAATAVAFERYDRVATSQSVEASHPFFDRRLVELCLSIPWQMKTGDGQPKRLLRAALRGALPPALTERSTGLSPHQGFLRAILRALEPWVEARLRQGAGEGLLAEEAVRRSWLRWRAGDPSQANPVWRAATLAAWSARSGSTVDDVPPG